MPGSKTKRLPNQVRIIGGNWRSRKVTLAPNPALRPSPDRVRETLFNWLQGQLAGRRTLELYGGSGVLSLEALSRGARHATLVERDAATVRHLRAEFSRFAAASQYAILQGDALEYAATCQETFDLIYLDPPFAGGALAKALPLAARLLTPTGLLYAESPAPLDSLTPPSLQPHKQQQAGQIHYALLQKPPA